jgi:hypothetical protein
MLRPSLIEPDHTMTTKHLADLPPGLTDNQLNPVIGCASLQCLVSHCIPQIAACVRL